MWRALLQRTASARPAPTQQRTAHAATAITVAPRCAIASAASFVPPLRIASAAAAPSAPPAAAASSSRRAFHSTALFARNGTRSSASCRVSRSPDRASSSSSSFAVFPALRRWFSSYNSGGGGGDEDEDPSHRSEVAPKGVRPTRAAVFADEVIEPAAAPADAFSSSSAASASASPRGGGGFFDPPSTDDQEDPSFMSDAPRPKFVRPPRARKAGFATPPSPPAPVVDKSPPVAAVAAAPAEAAAPTTAYATAFPPASSSPPPASPLPAAAAVDDIIESDKDDTSYLAQEPAFVNALDSTPQTTRGAAARGGIGSGAKPAPLRRNKQAQQASSSGDPRFSTPKASSASSPYATPHYTAEGVAKAAPAAAPAPTAAPDVFNSSFNSFTPTSTYVSSHYRMDPAAVLKYVSERKHLVFNRAPNADKITIRDCPFCRNIKGKADNQYKLTIWLDTGSFNCMRCGSKGSWFDFKKNLGDIPTVTNVMGQTKDASHAYTGNAHMAPAAFAPAAGSTNPNAARDFSPPLPASATAAANSKLAPPLPNQSVVHTYPANLFTVPRYKPVLDYLLNERGLTRETLMLYQIGATSHKFPNPLKNHAFEEQICISMPWVKTHQQIREIKTQMEAPTDKEKEAIAKARKKQIKVEKERAKLAAAAAAAAEAAFAAEAAQATSTIAGNLVGTVASLDAAAADPASAAPASSAAPEAATPAATAAAPENDSAAPAELAPIDPLVSPAAVAAAIASDTSAAASTPAPLSASTAAGAPVLDVSISSASDLPSFPSPSGDSQVTERIKLRSLTAKGNQRLLPSGGVWNFFGWHTIPHDADEIVITEGEFDAMACWQATGLPTVSLPNGARSLPVELLPLLERFDRIYLWLDDDAAGVEGADKFAKKLGVGRCLIVKTNLPKQREEDFTEEQLIAAEAAALVADANTAVAPVEQKKPPKDANDALRQGLDLKALIAAAQPVKHDQILQFRDLRLDVLREFTDPLARRGVQSRYLPSLNKLLKGHRPGELTIITGATGVGKTTVLSQISLDYCSQGVHTLWGSFEIRNTKLARTMISQYANMNFATEIPSATPAAAGEGEHVNLDTAMPDPRELSEPLVAQPVTSPAPDPHMLAQFNQWADRFEQLPLYFMKFFGSNSVESVLDAMEYAVYVYDVEHILLDNLQFMLSEQGRGYDRFEMQDRAVALFREFASAKNVHITLVIHPRKENDAQALGVSSIFGGAKATQEADNILIIQKPNVIDEASMGGSRPFLSQELMRQEIDRLKAEAASLRNGDKTAFNIFDHRRIEIKKNRFDGELGVIPFKYDRKTCRIYEINPATIAAAKKKEGAGSGSAGSGSGGSGAPATPAIPRAPKRERPVMFQGASYVGGAGGGGGGGGARDESAQAVQNANDKAAASMIPKETAASKRANATVIDAEIVEEAATPAPTAAPAAAPAPAVAAVTAPSTAAEAAPAAEATPAAATAPAEAATVAAPAPKVKKPRKPSVKKQPPAAAAADSESAASAAAPSSADGSAAASPAAAAVDGTESSAPKPKKKKASKAPPKPATTKKRATKLPQAAPGTVLPAPVELVAE